MKIFPIIYRILIKLRRVVLIYKYTSFRFYRASQISGKAVKFKINNKKVNIAGNSVWSMIEEVIISDSYHLKKLMNPKVILDVGANVGIFSIHAATLFPNCKIYSFEPSLDNFQLLKSNTIDFPNIICLNMALGNTDGIGFLSCDKDNTAYKLTTDKTNSNICNIITLETFIYNNSIKIIDSLKLDCEGSEYEILLSDLKIVKQVVGEFHVIESKNGDLLKTILKQQGFSIEQWREFPSKEAGLFWAKSKS